jgi:hypothetical protein
MRCLSIGTDTYPIHTCVPVDEYGISKSRGPGHLLGSVARLMDLVCQTLHSPVLPSTHPKHTLNPPPACTGVSNEFIVRICSCHWILVFASSSGLPYGAWGARQQIDEPYWRTGGSSPKPTPMRTQKSTRRCLKRGSLAEPWLENLPVCFCTSLSTTVSFETFRANLGIPPALWAVRRSALSLTCCSS